MGELDMLGAHFFLKQMPRRHGRQRRSMMMAEAIDIGKMVDTHVYT
ncbi:MAG: hypothetical protein K0B16_16335 [Burkholderiaceae bacterium]|nr:hypothetical protein [Burkholderiaceae bacterium]